MADSNTNNLPYPMQFDSSQWSNKYSPYAGVALPNLAAYSGMATNAFGNPIQSYVDAQNAQAQQPASAMPPSTTLNSSPAQPGPMTGGAYGDWRGFVGGGAGASPQANQMAYNLGFGGLGPAGDLNPASASGQAYASAHPSQPAATPQAAPQQGSQIDMGQAYLQALANPGKVTTPGATVPQAAPPSSQSGVLQQFMQNWQNNGSPTTGAGNYNNQGFFNALKGAM